jgi:hypothetical protein
MCYTLTHICRPQVALPASFDGLLPAAAGPAGAPPGRHPDLATPAVFYAERRMFLPARWCASEPCKLVQSFTQAPVHFRYSEQRANDFVHRFVWLPIGAQTARRLRCGSGQ